MRPHESSPFSREKSCYVIDLMTTQPAQPNPPRRGFRWGRVLVAGVLWLVALWLVHPPVLARVVRFGLMRAAADADLRLEVGKIQARIGQPLVFEKVRLRAQDAAVSRTAADAARVEIGFNWPWQAFSGEKRVVRAVLVEDLRGVFDLRPPEGAAPSPLPDLTPAEQRAQAERTLQFLPKRAELRHASLEVLAPEQSYYLEDASAVFSEEATGKFHAAAAEIHAGNIHESLGTLEGITAWKGGTAYLADLAVRDGLKIENFLIELARPGGLAMGLDAAVYGGSLRADVSLGTQAGQVAVDAAVWASQVNASPLSTLLGLKGKAEGVLREGRFTFRGIPAQALDGQASLRLAADGFRWNKRGWESLKIGANLIHRRLAVSDFELRQKDNTLAGNGEVLVTRDLHGLAKAPFLLNLSGSIKDLGALAGLFGPPFDEMSGRMSLSSSVNGQDGRLTGFLSLEASDMNFRQHPIQSGRVEVNFANNEAQVSQCEFWSGTDYLRGKGAVAIAAPHNYSGEIQARSEDLAAYLSFFPQAGVPAISGGAVQVRWQGDGTTSAHSGAFNVSLDQFVSERTPSGLTGRFAGTYSPQNVYFSGFELDQGPLRFSTQATLANSGLKLKNAILRGGGRDLADAEIFLPLDPFALAAGKPLQEAMLPDKEVYASVASRGSLGLRDLLRLAGNDLPVEGTLQLALKASGLPAALALDGKIEGRGLAMRFENETGPVSQLDATLRAANGTAVLAGVVNTRGLPPLTLKAESPFGFARAADGSLRWMNPDGQIAAQLEIPKTNLGIFRAFFPGVQNIEGTLSGGLTATGTVAKPELNGRLALTGGRIKVSTRAPVLGNLNGAVKFDPAGATIEKFTGDVAAGPFEIRGGVSFADFSNLQYDLIFKGDKILLARDPGLRLRANVDLRAAGNSAAGSVTGSVRLVDGRIYRRLEITPLLAPSPVDEAFFVPPRFDGLAPAPFGAWKLDVTIKNETPFTLVGNLAAGEIVPDLRLTGTLGRPVPIGRIEVKGARAFLPFTTMNVDNGFIDFIESDPWMPQLDIRASAQALDYDVQALAFGPLNERHLILRSDPPLSQESLILLLTAGLPPGVFAGAGFGEAAVGQGGLLLLRAFVRQFDTQKVDLDSLVNRLQISSVPPELQGRRATLRGRFRLWQGLSLMSERDSFGFYNAGATYSLRFR